MQLSDIKIENETKVTELLKTFTSRERDAYSYMLDLFKNDMLQLYNCNREIYTYENKDTKYPAAVKAATNSLQRLKYIFQCFNLFVEENLQDMSIAITSTTSKKKS